MKRIVFLFSIATVLVGCQTTTTKVEPDPSVLRVGVTPRSRPMIFKLNGQICGIEADFAHQLGNALNRKVVFVEVPWDKQIDYLEQNKTDIIMSNMTITKARGIRVNFTTPYLQSGMTALFRRNNAVPEGLIASVIKNQNRKIGFVKNTTGEFFSVERFSRGELIGFDSTDAAVTALRNERIDMFVHDAPVIWWLSATHERELVAFYDLLNREPIAWAVGKHNMALRDEIDGILRDWDESGEVSRIIQNWIPTFRN
jgi:ABC-type amino acid transport substrate-binding protein